MAKAKSAEVRSFIAKTPKKHGRHAKSESNNKRSKNYKKPYRGQGK
jgi:hypothetical protein